MSTPDIGVSHRRSAVICAAIAFLPVPTAIAAVLANGWERVEKSALASAPPPPPATAPMVPEAPPADVARTELATLTVETPHSLEGYSREKFEHWIEDHWPRTRQVVLIRDSKHVGVQAKAQTASKNWHSPYDDRILTMPSEVHVDHVVPLANAWRSGADEWSAARRHKFANDLSTTQLIAVSVVANRAKGDQSPDQWVPPNTAFHCVYGRAWTHVKFTYGLSVTQKEKDALLSILDTCR
ncbi:HNH endonuclease family protein [Streptomyces sp. NBC_00487]|uniref:HNH endonuclease family protein n=1 Tax=unclassified Streptomyces TaxID=2593676 RepID=UPI002E18118A|nr:MULTISPECIES: HNH endonuclease family protein [unclassified Streptomyces]